jgi:bifunctional non-homologous end joining protein LigD
MSKFKTGELVRKLQSCRHDKAAILYAFDIIELDGADLRREPLIRRKERIPRALRQAPVGLQLSEHMDGDAAVTGDSD